MVSFLLAFLATCSRVGAYDTIEMVQTKVSGGEAEPVRSAELVRDAVQDTTDASKVSVLPTCQSHGGTVWAFCHGEPYQRWGIGPEGEAQATGNCNHAARIQQRWGHCPADLRGSYVSAEVNCWKSGDRHSPGYGMHGTFNGCAAACATGNGGNTCPVIEYGATWGCFRCNDGVTAATLTAQGANQWNQKTYFLITTTTTTTAPTGLCSYDSKGYFSYGYPHGGWAGENVWVDDASRGCAANKGGTVVQDGPAMSYDDCVNACDAKSDCNLIICKHPDASQCWCRLLGSATCAALPDEDKACCEPQHGTCLFKKPR